MARIVYTDSSNRECSVYLGPDQPVVSIGRATDCTIRSNRKSVSRHHAEFRFNNGAFEVIDLNSSNGTWLIENEQRFEISHERLEDQDEIWCGDFIIHFLLEDAAEDEVTVNDSHPGGEPQYVSGPTEAADAFDFNADGFGADDFGADGFSADGFGAEPSEVHLDQGGAGLSQPSSVAFDYDDVEELGADELVELDERAPAGNGYGDEVERLRQEKQSIEDLASRQAFEIEELQAELEQVQSQLEQVKPQLERAREEAAESMQSQLDQAMADVDELRRENEQLRDEVQRSEDELAAARGELDEALEQARQKAREQASQLEGALADKTARVEALEHDVRTLEDELAKASGSGGDADKLRAQLDEVRAQLEKSNRLLNEYERRNAELRTELDEQREANAALRRTAGENEAKLAELFDAREQLERQVAQLDGVKEALDDKGSQLEAAEQLNANLKAEVQGLKQRLQLERRRSDEDVTEELERLEAELVEATERISELEQEREGLAAQLAEAEAPDEEADEALTADALAELHGRLSALERLADAIDRTDLEPLSTVDRIRLQSAIRETDPKKTLREALDLLAT